MNHHHVTCDEHGDLTFTCTAGTEDWCTVAWDCDCEQLYDLRNEGDGRWSHSPHHDDTEVRHVGTAQPGRECNYITFVTADDPRYVYDGIDYPRWDDDGEPLEWPSGPVTFSWEGDYYSWDYVGVPA